MIAVRFGYTLEEVPSPGAVMTRDPLVGHMEVDPERRDPQRLRDELEPWALDRLLATGCEFGLYVAEFGSWKRDGKPAYCLRLLHIIWSGEDPIVVHSEDSEVNFAGVRALALQAEAFEGLRHSEPSTSRT